MIDGLGLLLIGLMSFTVIWAGFMFWQIIQIVLYMRHLTPQTLRLRGLDDDAIDY